VSDWEWLWKPGVASLNAYDAARRICAGCAVTAQCLAAAMAEEDGDTKRHGMRGGLCPSERYNLAKRRRRRRTKPLSVTDNATYDDDDATTLREAG
jgi:hypothetical protein